MPRIVSPSFVVPVVLLTMLAWSPGATADDAPEAESSQDPTLQEATLQDPTLPATGRQVTRLTIPTTGRWSVRAESARGVALRLVDRMSGPGAWAGAAGGDDGRLDLFLDAGVYRIETRGADAPSDERVSLEVAEFVTRDGVRVDTARASEVSAGELSLRDLEARRFELVVRRGAEHVVLEAAGQHLADLRLWRADADGRWMLDVQPSAERIEPRVGEPLTLLRLAARLDPGVYDVVAYGGPGLPWAVDGDEAPLHLRSGVPRLAAAERLRRQVSPFGFDRYLLPEATDFVRFEVPRSDPPRESSMSVVVAPWQVAQPFDDRGATVVVTQETVPPVAVLGARSGVVKRVTVRGEAGRPYVLQHLAQVRPTHGLSSGRRWLSVLRAGSPRDLLDVTAVLESWQSGDRRRSWRGAGLPVRAGDVIERALDLAGLSGEQTLGLEVEEAVDLRVEADGLTVRLEPIEVALGRAEDRPAPREDEGSWRLEPGSYRLGLVPRRAGVLTLRLVADGVQGAAMGELGEPEARRASARFGVVDLSAQQSHRLHLGVGPAATVIDRPLPVHLGPGQRGAPLPLALSSTVPVEVPVRAGGAGRLIARAEDGSLLDVSLDGAPWAREILVPASGITGTLRLRASSDLALPVWALAAFEPSPPPAPTQDPTPPEVLRAGTPRFLDLDRESSARFAVEVDEPALYRLASTGLIDVVGAVATPTAPALDRDDDSGPGRNFLLQTTLRAGRYRLEMATLGRSRGRFGVHLERAPVAPGGMLRLGVAARRALAPGDAVSYQLPIAEAGRYRLRVLGLGQPFRVRLEDDDGWPLLPPGPLDEADVELAVGDYRVVVLPQAVAARAVVRVDRVVEAPTLRGRGPHALPLDRSVEHVWREPSGDLPADAPARADLWRVELPAAADLEIAVPDAGPDGRLGGFEATLVPADSRESDRAVGRDDEVLVRIPPRGWSGRVEAGSYLLRVRAVRRDDRRAYAVRVTPRQLVPGLERRIDVPSRLEVAVGEEGLYELTTFGALDVRARLLAAAADAAASDGEPLAQADDRPGDWNPRLAQRLAPGRYVLALDPVAGARGEGAGAAVDVTFTHLREIDDEPLRVESGARRAAERRIELGDAVVSIPLEPTAGADLLVATAVGDGAPLELALEARDGAADPWRVLGATSTAGEGMARLAVALSRAGGVDGDLAPGAALRLRLEAPDRGATAATVRIAAAPAARRLLRAGEETTPKLAALPPLGDEASSARLGVARLDLAPDAAPTCLALRGDAWSATRPGESLAPAPPLQASAGGGVWLLGDPARPPRVEARVLNPGEATRLAVSAGGGRCAVAAGGPLVVLVEGVDAAADVQPLATPAARAVELGGRRSLAVLPASTAPRGLGIRGSREVTVRAVEPTISDTAAVGWGASDARVEPGGLLRLALPPGEKRLRLTLDGDLAAALLGDDRVETDRMEAVLWSDAGAVETVVETAAAELLIVDTGMPARGGMLRLAVDVPDGEPAAPLAAGRPFEERVVTVGRRQLAVEPPSAYATLRLRGARGAVFLGADGTSRRVDRAGSSAEQALDLPLTPGVGGRLLVEHEPGFLLAWVDPDGGAPGPWPASAAGDSPRELTPPSLVPLDGLRRSYSIDLDAPAIVHLRAATPSVSALWTEGATRPEIRVHAATTALDRPLPAGRSRLELRGLAAPLAGTLRVDLEQPPRLGEGLGPEVLLEPGASRFFRVELDRATDLGFGVRAAGGAGARLLDAAGRTLGAGVVLQRRLAPGTYFLALELPPGADPVRARPAVAGLEPPDSGPPREIVERYLSLRPQPLEPEQVSEREADDGAEGDRVGRRLVEVVERVGVVVRVDVDADARQQIDLPSQAAGEERVGGVVRQAVREDHADAGGGVKGAADADIGDRRQGALVGATEPLVVVLEVDLEVEQAARLELVGQDVGEAVVFDVAEAVVGNVVDSLPEAGAEAQTMLGGLGRGRADEGAKDEEDAENA
ncbi:MAG: hypothetical protein AAGC60_25535 [Acidobacteriota bacterium]